MKKKKQEHEWVRVVCCGVMLGGFLLLGTAAQAQETATVDAQERQGLSLVVYQQNHALVTDIRTMTLPAGESTVVCTDVASRIIPESVLLTAHGGSNDLRVLEQTFAYDLANERAILEKYYGSTVVMVNENKEQDRADRIEATVMGGYPQWYYLINGELCGNPPGYTVFPDAEKRLALIPALRWHLASEHGGDYVADISYLVDGMSWQADYSLSLDEGAGEATVAAWITLHNDSGMAYHDAQVSVVAGDVSFVTPSPRTPPSPVFKRAAMMEAAVAADTAYNAAPSRAADYYRFDFPRKLTVPRYGEQNIHLFDQRRSTFEKEYSVRSAPVYAQQRSVQEEKVPVRVRLTFDNTEQNHLGIPLPQGTVRVYDSAGGARTCIGESVMQQVAAGDTAEIMLGSAFDVTAKRVQTDYRQITSRQYETAWRITLANYREEAVMVSVYETMAGNWELIESSQEGKKESAAVLRFTVEVPAKGSEVLRYRVRMGM